MENILFWASVAIGALFGAIWESTTAPLEPRATPRKSPDLLHALLALWIGFELFGEDDDAS